MNLPNQEEFEDTLRIICRNKDVDKYNMIKFNRLESDKFTIKAQDTYSNSADFGMTVKPMHLYNDVEKTGGMLNVIVLAVGCRVMLRRNKTPSLVSGSMGTVTGFNWPSLERNQKDFGELPLGVFIKFDDKEIVKKCQDPLLFDGDSILIKPELVEFEGKSGKTVSRKMLPLILCWAVTAHKIQGIEGF